MYPSTSDARKVRIPGVRSGMSVTEIRDLFRPYGSVEGFVQGDYPTKSNGRLQVAFARPFDSLSRDNDTLGLFSHPLFFAYNSAELEKAGADIRGLRGYCVVSPDKDALGAAEFHKVRYEILCCVTGRFELGVEDLTGKKEFYTLESGEAIEVPPYLMHTYRALDEKSLLFVIANTLFFVDDKTISDSYMREEWDSLAQKL